MPSRSSGDDVVAEYVDAVVGSPLAPRGDAGLRIAYTPMHGVGRDVAVRVLDGRRVRASGGGARPGRPRSRLPHRRLPEPGGARRDGPAARTGAAASGADVAIANDPDADRLAVAVPDGRRRPAAGARSRATRSAPLLGDWRLAHDGRAETGSSPRRSCRRRCSAKLAAEHGVDVRRDAHRVQVAGPGGPRPARPATGLRLRGGARLLRRRRRARQGRHLRRPGLRRAGRRREGRAADRCSTASTTSHRRHGVHLTVQRLDPLRRSRRRSPGPRRWSTGWPRRPPASVGDRAGRRRRRPAAGGIGGLPPSDVRPAPPRRRPRRRPPERHRAQAQGLHRGRRPRRGNGRANRLATVEAALACRSGE